MGICLGVKASRNEILDCYKPSAGRRVPIQCSRARPNPWSPARLMRFVPADATAAGASVHRVHITRRGLRETPCCCSPAMPSPPLGSSFDNSARYSEGGPYVLGNGVFLVRAANSKIPGPPPDVDRRGSDRYQTIEAAAVFPKRWP
jgi:hypothetical protein